VVKVLALIGDLAPTCRDRFPLTVSVLRPPFRALQSLLRGSEPLRGGATKTRILNVLAVAGGGETGDPDIDAGLTPGRRQRTHRHLIARQDQHPAPPAALNLDRLDPPYHRAVHVDLDLADALQIHPVSLRQPARAVPVFGPFHAVKPGRALKPRIPSHDTGLGRFDPAEKPSERLVQPAQRGLLARERPDRLIGACLADLGKLRRLLG
jgi:hypothetical protein